MPSCHHARGARAFQTRQNHVFAKVANQGQGGATMARMTALPETWRTRDLWPTDVRALLRRHVRGESAAILYGSKWWIVRFLDPRDKRRVTALGHVREARPWERAVEIISCGKTLDEACFYLRGGRTLVGVRPVHDARGEWCGFVDAQGNRLDGAKLIGAEEN